MNDVDYPIVGHKEKSPICNNCKHDYTGRQLEVMCMDENNNCQKCRAELSGKFCTGQGIKDDSAKPKAVQILNEAVAVMAERGKSYDKSGGEAERSMPKIVAMFNALTGHELTPEQGWKFMCCLKLARSEQGEYREDNYLDGAAYMALAGEEAEASSEQ